MSYFIKQVLKKILRMFERVMPKAFCDAFYGVAFPVYRATVRAWVGFRWIVASLIGRSENAEMFKKIHQVMPYSLVGVGGLEATYRLARMANEKGLSGDFVELGVARGGCAALIAGVALDPSNSVSSFFMMLPRWFSTVFGLI